MRLRLALALAVGLAACDSGGSGGGPNVPFVPWGNFRQNNTNSAVNGTIQRNAGEVRLLYEAEPGEITRSTPTIDRNSNLLLATSTGVVSLDQDDGTVRWSFEGYSTADAPTTPCSVCVPGSSGCVAVGPVVASPTVSPGNDIVFGSEGPDGRLFVIYERGTDITCRWIFPPAGQPGIGFTSSAAVLINSIDSSLSSVFVGADDAQLRALDADGTVRWSVSGSGPITSSPALDGTGTAYATTPNGIVPVVSFDGVLSGLSPSIGVPPPAPADIPFQSSAAVGPNNVYAVGSGGTVFAFTPPGVAVRQFTSVGSPITSSPAFTGQSFSQGSETLFDTVVYVVDSAGTAFAFRDLTGGLLQLQRCQSLESGAFDLMDDCRMDSCLPDGSCGTNGRCSNDEEQGCTRDSCPEGSVCTTLPFCEDPPQSTGCGNTVALTPDTASQVHTSPVLSGDLFAVAGTTDGRICARTIQNQAPGETLDPPTAAWASGCIDLAASDTRATKSSPIIGQNGRMYVTTDAGLYEIK